MKKNIIIFVLAILTSILFADNNPNLNKYLELWPNLKQIDLKWNGIILYDENRVTLLNDENLILKFYLKNKINQFYIKKAYGPLPPFDNLIITKNSNDNKNNKLLSSKLIIISESGILYTEKPIADNGFYKINITQKWIETENKITEICQPFYFIGENCKATVNIELFEKPDETSEKVATIRELSEIYVIGTNGATGTDKDWYLIKSVTGLVGWHKPYYIKTEKTITIFSISLLSGNLP